MDQHPAKGAQSMSALAVGGLLLGITGTSIAQQTLSPVESTAQNVQTQRCLDESDDEIFFVSCGGIF